MRLVATRARHIRRCKTGAIVTAGLVAIAILPARAEAQDEAGRTEADTSAVADSVYSTSIAGEFRPAKGFDLVRTKRASLNISFYGLFRYMNQSPGTFTDHLGRERTVKARNDLNWHRTFVWLTGFFYVPRFRYNISLWSLPTTQQTLLFGNLQYRFSPAFGVGVGIAPNLTARSVQGSWPFWGSSDRQMAEDFFRGGFSSGFFVTGQPLQKFWYTASINTNISQLGTTAANDSRDMAYSASIAWRPTTGEFGPRGGLGDFEYHRKLATQFGISACHSRESRYANDTAPPNATQIKLSDGVNPFDADALAPGVTVQKLNYDEMAFDAGFKYRGFSFQSEYYVRKLSDFKATGPLPLESLVDHGFQVQGMHMVVPRLIGVYFTYGRVFDDFDRNPWEVSGGASYYPSRSRSWRLNLHLIKIEKSPAASNFGFYTSGQSGTTISLGTDILL
ncbi:MAG TPA: hypothetical protein VL853_07890 [Gemmatimonadales bacterium]|jgi:hypothetical protein|nr:hypothetical protein [Gemmatimonadales bacterium]